MKLRSEAKKLVAQSSEETFKASQTSIVYDTNGKQLLKFKMCIRDRAYTAMQPVNKIHLRYCKADSKNKNPKGIVLYYKGKHLKKNKDYKIVKKEGHKYVIVKGRGRYRGTKKIYLKTK